jgi:UDP-GlcNAc:undecaprenyl-phosphate GlcNAc-1-phosphate transferase
MVTTLCIMLLITSILALGGVHLTQALGILDKPGPDVPKRPRVPTLQGVFLLLNVSILLLLFYKPHLPLTSGSPFFALSVWLCILAIVSCIDEMWYLVSKKRSVPAKVRLLVQIWVASLAFFIWDIHVETLPLMTETLPIVVQYILTVIWFLLFINAINFFDGIYGLATGMASIWFLTTALLIGIVASFFPDISPERLLLLQWTQGYARVFFVVSAVYAWIEFRPRGVVRDVGTISVGFALAYLALLGGAKVGTVIVVLSLPIFDAVRVIIDRLRRGVNPFHGDYTHLHHRLLAIGRSRSEVRWFMWIFSLVLMTLMLLQWPDRMGKVIIFVLVACLFFGINIYLFRVKKLPSNYRPSLTKTSA